MAEISLTYVGHATNVIELDGASMITDPLLRDRVWHLSRTACKINQAVLKRIDVVMISHAHWDHLDIPSLRMLERDTHLIIPRGLGAMLEKQGFRNISELSAGEQLIVRGIAITATIAKHNGARYRFGPSADTLGYIIEGTGSIYYAGDTELFKEMTDLVSELDIALLPVWGWGPTLGAGHMNPYQAAQAVKILNPKIAVPIHWGTFFPLGLRWIYPKALIHPPVLFANFVTKLAPEVEVKILNPGEQLELEL